jgi:hypothetical protein
MQFGEWLFQNRNAFVFRPHLTHTPVPTSGPHPPDGPTTQPRAGPARTSAPCTPRESRLHHIAPWSSHTLRDLPLPCAPPQPLPHRAPVEFMSLPPDLWVEATTSWESKDKSCRRVGDCHDAIVVPRSVYTAAATIALLPSFFQALRSHPPIMYV